MVHLVLFASEQTIPNLMAVELVRRVRPNTLLQVHIYTTLSSEKSLVPGEKLKWLIETKQRAQVEMGPSSPCQAPGPADVQTYLRDLMHTSSHEWFVCLNGGTRLMTYGFLGMSAGPKQIYFYRDLETGCWYELSIELDGSIRAVAPGELECGKEPLLTDYTIAELIELQHPGRHSRMGTAAYDFQVTLDAASNECGTAILPSGIGGGALIDRLKRRGSEAFDWSKFGDPSSRDSVIFEAMIGHLIMALFPAKFEGDARWRIRRGVQLSRPTGGQNAGQQLNEIDVVLFDGSALHLFEMKLKTMDSAETLPALITRYAQLRRQLAGLAGTATIVAPNSIGQPGSGEAADERLRASAKTFDVELWGVQELVDIAEHLTKQLGVPHEQYETLRLAYFSCLRPHPVPVAETSLVDLAWDALRLKSAHVAEVSQPKHQERFQFFPCHRLDKDRLMQLLDTVKCGLTWLECCRGTERKFAGMGTWSALRILDQLKKENPDRYEEVLKIARKKLGYDHSVSPSHSMEPLSTKVAPASRDLGLTWDPSPGS